MKKNKKKYKSVFSDININYHQRVLMFINKINKDVKDLDTLTTITGLSSYAYMHDEYIIEFLRFLNFNSE